MNAEVLEKGSLQTEELEKNKRKLTFKVGREQFAEGINYAYNDSKSRFNIPGFRKGKVPRALIEMHYGKEIFFEEAIKYVLDDAYKEAADESGLDIVARPEIDIVSISSEDGVVFTAEVYIKPEVQIANYTGLTYNKQDEAATDEEIDQKIGEAREKNARLVSVTDRPAAMGDTVTIDYAGTKDGVAFDGGTAGGHELTLGSNSFVDTFEQQIVGANIGDTLEVNVTFPQDYHSAELAGESVVFNVTVHEIRTKELPELNDDFAQDVSEFDTLAQYRESIAQEISAGKAESAKRDKENQLMRKLIELVEVDLPPVMAEQQAEQMTDDMKRRITQSGMPFDMYLKYIGQTLEEVHEANKKIATERITVRLALEEIAKIEGFDVAEDEVNAEIERIAGEYGLETDKFKSVMLPKDIEGIKTDLKVQKAVELVVSSAVEG